MVSPSSYSQPPEFQQHERLLSKSVQSELGAKSQSVADKIQAWFDKVFYVSFGAQGQQQSLKAFTFSLKGNALFAASLMSKPIKNEGRSQSLKSPIINRFFNRIGVVMKYLGKHVLIRLHTIPATIGEVVKNILFIPKFTLRAFRLTKAEYLSRLAVNSQERQWQTALKISLANVTRYFPRIFIGNLIGPALQGTTLFMGGAHKLTSMGGRSPVLIISSHLNKMQFTSDKEYEKELREKEWEINQKIKEISLPSEDETKLIEKDVISLYKSALNKNGFLRPEEVRTLVDKKINELVQILKKKNKDKNPLLVSYKAEQYKNELQLELCPGLFFSATKADLNHFRTKIKEVEKKLVIAKQDKENYQSLVLALSKNPKREKEMNEALANFSEACYAIEKLEKKIIDIQRRADLVESGFKEPSKGKLAIEPFNAKNEIKDLTSIVTVRTKVRKRVAKASRIAPT